MSDLMQRLIATGLVFAVIIAFLSIGAKIVRAFVNWMRGE